MLVLRLRTITKNVTELKDFPKTLNCHCYSNHRQKIFKFSHCLENKNICVYLVGIQIYF